MSLATPTWVNVPVAHEPESGLEPALADVHSRIKVRPNPYYDSRHVTFTHESTHGLNAQVRNGEIRMLEQLQISFPHAQFGMPEPDNYLLPRPATLGERVATAMAMDEVVPFKVYRGDINGFYVLEGRGVQLQEPAFKLNDVANAVPSSLQGMSFQLYLRQQQQYWNGQPLYVLDEWAAYTNGLTCALQGSDGTYSDTLQAVEFMGYAWCLLKLAADKGHSQFDDLRNFIAWQSARVRGLYDQTKGNGQLSSAKTDSHLATLLGSELKDFMQAECGMAWKSVVVDGQEWYGVF